MLKMTIKVRVLQFFNLVNDFFLEENEDPQPENQFENVSYNSEDTSSALSVLSRLLMMEISICILISALSGVSIYLDNSIQKCHSAIVNVGTWIICFLVLVRMNTYVHTLHYYYKYNNKTIGVPIIIFFIELLTIIGSMVAKIYWEVETSDWDNFKLGFLIMTVIMLISYFYLFRLCIGITIPCIFLLVLWIYIWVRRRIERRRLRRELMRRMNLPNWKYHFYIENLNENRNAEQMCWICLNDFEADDDVTLFPCGNHHIFHKKCITQWMLHNDTWPVDRTPL